jgi:hypothetical protein
LGRQEKYTKAPIKIVMAPQYIIILCAFEIFSIFSKTGENNSNDILIFFIYFFAPPAKLTHL